MDGKLEVREYLKLCHKQWQWILDNYDRVIEEGSINAWHLKGAYFDEYGLDKPRARCYLCELTDQTCLECPLSGIAWRKDHDFPCTDDPGSVYFRILYYFCASRDEEAKDAIKEFLSIIDKECRRKAPKEVQTRIEEQKL